jgi:nucleoside-diphosphate-sugar epimerase
VIDVRDVAVGFAEAVKQRRFGRRIALMGHNLSNEMLFRWICEIGNVPPPRLVAPSDGGVVASYLTESILGALGAEAPLPAIVAMLTYMHSYLPPSAEQSELGFRLRPLSATLMDTIGWYREIGYC